jgi:hypothetical protein
MTEEKKRVHPDDVLKTISDVAESLGYFVHAVKIGWFVSHGMNPQYQTTTYDAETK